jgi:hypothetical protein
MFAEGRRRSSGGSSGRHGHALWSASSGGCGRGSGGSGSVIRDRARVHESVACVP